MSPTSTEHDFRFPRRPADSGSGDIKPEQSERSAYARTNKSTGTASLIANQSPNTTHRTSTSTSTNKPKNAADMRGSLKEVRFDLSKTFDNARGSLSKTDAFAGFQDGIAGMSTSPSHLGKEDPLAAQVWRFFSKTKQSLPNQERMENLTWRMMHTSLRKQRLANDESSRYACLARYLRDASNGSPRCIGHAVRRNDKVLTCHFLTKFRWECSQRHRPVAKII
jgi:GATA-binding protein